MLRVPGITEAERRVVERVGQVDVVPTLLDALGQRVPEHLQGHSWLPFLRGEGPLADRHVFVEWGGAETGIVPGARLRDSIPTYWREMASDEEIVAALSDPVRTVIAPDGCKYTWSTIGDDELYDLNKDPYETHNRAKDRGQHSRVETLRGEIRRWQQRTGDTVRFF